MTGTRLWITNRRIENLFASLVPNKWLALQYLNWIQKILFKTKVTIFWLPGFQIFNFNSLLLQVSLTPGKADKCSTGRWVGNKIYLCRWVVSLDQGRYYAGNIKGYCWPVWILFILCWFFLLLWTELRYFLLEHDFPSHVQFSCLTQFFLPARIWFKTTSNNTTFLFSYPCLMK